VGLEVPVAGCVKSGGKEEENKNLKQEVKTLKEELDTAKKGEQGAPVSNTPTPQPRQKC